MIVVRIERRREGERMREQLGGESERWEGCIYIRNVSIISSEILDHYNELRNVTHVEESRWTVMRKERLIKNITKKQNKTK